MKLELRARNLAEKATFEELQVKWSKIRGETTVRDMRPDLQALIAPLDVKVKFSSPLKSNRTPRSPTTSGHAPADVALEDTGCEGQMTIKPGVTLPPVSPRPPPQALDSSARLPTTISEAVPSVVQLPALRPPLPAADSSQVQSFNFSHKNKQKEENCVHQ